MQYAHIDFSLGPEALLIEDEKIGTSNMWFNEEKKISNDPKVDQLCVYFSTLPCLLSRFLSIEHLAFFGQAPEIRVWW